MKIKGLATMAAALALGTLGAGCSGEQVEQGTAATGNAIQTGGEKLESGSVKAGEAITNAAD